MTSAREGESEEQFDKDWKFPCFNLLEEHMESLSEEHGTGKDSTDGPDSSATTLELLQR